MSFDERYEASVVRWGRECVVTVVRWVCTTAGCREHVERAT
jgi:hypothetical protein